MKGNFLETLELMNRRMEKGSTAKRQHVDISDLLMLIDTWQMVFNMCQIENHRFMFSPQSGELILGKQYKGNQLCTSHAEEHGESDTKTPYDSFIRSWVGTTSQYPNGIIHFAPHVEKTNIKQFRKAFLTLEMFGENGADGQTVIRGLGNVWEQSLSNIIPNQERAMAEYAQYKRAALGKSVGQGFFGKHSMRTGEEV